MSAPSWFDWKKSTSSPSSAARVGDPGVDLVERLVAVDLRLARPDEVEVRALEDEHGGHRGLPAAEQRRRRPRSTTLGVDVVADDDAVGGRAGPSAAGPPACFLSVARWLEDRRRAGRGAAPSPGRGASSRPADPLGALRRRHADLDADPRRRAQPVRDRLAVEQLAEAGRRLDRVAERVPEVERDPPAGGAALALVGDDDLDLGPGGPLDDLGDDARRERRRVAAARSPRPSASSSSNSRSSPSAAILTASPSAARRWRSGSVRKRGDVDDDRGRLVERADEVLALGQVDAGLAADRRVDLGDERRRDLDERDAAQVRRGEEAGRVAERAAADRDERLAALDAQAGELAGRRLDDREALGGLALRAAGPCSTVAAARAQAGGEPLADRRPRAGLGDEDRAPAPAARPAPRRARRPRSRRRGRSGRSASSPGAAWSPVAAPARAARPAGRVLDRVDDAVDLGDARLVRSARRRRTARAGRARSRIVPIGSRPGTSGRTCGERRRRWARTSGRPSSQTDGPAAVQGPAVARIDDGPATGRDDPADLGVRSAGPRSATAARSSARKAASPSSAKISGIDRPAAARSARRGR